MGLSTPYNSRAAIEQSQYSLGRLIQSPTDWLER
jgi:hypothetical protein